MAFSRKRLGTTLSLIALFAISLGIGYFWSHERAGPEIPPGLAAADYTSPCPVSDSSLARSLSDADTGTTTTTLKIASPVPQNSYFAERLIAAARDIRELSSGRVVTKFYFGGVQGDARTVLKKMRVGMLHGGMFSAAELAERYPDVALYGLPFLFRSPGEIAYVREKLDAQLREGLAEAGLETFCIASAGFSRFMSIAPVRSNLDLRGRQAWYPEGDPIAYTLLREAGAAPVPLPVGDVFVGLKTRLVDVAPVTPVGAILMQWYREVAYLTRLPLRYQYWLLAVDRKAFRKIAPGDQATVRSILNAVFQELDSMAWHDQTEALLALENGGIEMVDPDPEWAEELQKLGDEVAIQLIEAGKLSPDLYNRARAVIEEYRASN